MLARHYKHMLYAPDFKADLNPLKQKSFPMSVAALYKNSQQDPLNTNSSVFLCVALHPPKGVDLTPGQ